MKMWMKKLVAGLQDEGLRGRLKENAQVIFVALIWISLTVALFEYDRAHPKSPHVQAPANAIEFHQAKFQ